MFFITGAKVLSLFDLFLFIFNMIYINNNYELYVAAAEDL